MDTKIFHNVETREVDDVPKHTLADVTPKLEKIRFKYPFLLQLNILLLGTFWLKLHQDTMVV